MPFWRQEQRRPDGSPPLLSPLSSFRTSWQPLPTLSVDGVRRQHLPQPSGPHSVGFVDLLTPGPPSEGTLARLLYPTSEQCLGEPGRWPAWAEDRYLSGMLSFMQSVLARWPSWAPRSEYYGMERLRPLSPYLPRAGFPALFRAFVGRVHVPIVEGAAPLEADDEGGWPLVVFSHGLGCARSTYSRVCYDLASHGFVVAAVEHRDGSACASFYEDAAGERVWVPHRQVGLAEGEDEYAERNAQCHIRSAEATRALDLLTRMKQGVFPESPSLVPAGFDLATIARVTDVRRPIIAGHSFGGATTVLTLAKDPRFIFGISLDPWLFPLKDEDIAGDVDKPLLVISTDSFRSKENLEKIGELRNPPNGCERSFYYIRGSVHQNYLDAPFLLPYTLLKRITGTHSETSPEVVLDLSNKLSLQFALRQLGAPPDAEIDADVAKQGGGGEPLLRDLFAEEAPCAPSPGWP